MDIPTVLFFAAFAAIVGFFGYKMFRHGGFRAAMFGARIERTVGEVGGQNQGPVRLALKVHILHREAAEKLIGIEFTEKSFGGYQMMPIALSLYQAEQLVSLLQDAIHN